MSTEKKKRKRLKKLQLARTETKSSSLTWPKIQRRCEKKTQIKLKKLPQNEEMRKTTTWVLTSLATWPTFLLMVISNSYNIIVEQFKERKTDKWRNKVISQKRFLIFINLFSESDTMGTTSQMTYMWCFVLKEINVLNFWNYVIVVIITKKELIICKKRARNGINKSWRNCYELPYEPTR